MIGLQIVPSDRRRYFTYFYCCTVHIVNITAFIPTHAHIYTFNTLIHINLLAPDFYV